LPYRGDTPQSIVTVGCGCNRYQHKPKHPPSQSQPNHTVEYRTLTFVPPPHPATSRHLHMGVRVIAVQMRGCRAYVQATQVSQRGVRYTHKPRRRTHLQECFAHTGTYPPASSRHLVSNMHGIVDRMWVGKARRGLQWCSHRPTLHRFAGNEYRTTQRAQMAMYSAPLRSHPDSFPNT
jgi:hypothetical protein